MISAFCVAYLLFYSIFFLSTYTHAETHSNSKSLGEKNWYHYNKGQCNAAVFNCDTKIAIEFTEVVRYAGLWRLLESIFK